MGLGRRVEKIERRTSVAVEHDRGLFQMLARCQVAMLPGLEHVTPDDTDAETYRDIRSTLAMARGDFEEARRLEDAAPKRAWSEPQPREERSRATHAAPIPGERHPITAEFVAMMNEMARAATESAGRMAAAAARARARGACI